MPIWRNIQTLKELIMITKFIRFIFLILAYFPYLWWKIGSYLINKDEAFQGASQFCSLFPGKIGTLLRAAFYRLSLQNTSQKTSIAFLTTFSNTKAKIASHVSIGSQCNIGYADIAENCILSSQVCITSGKNQHSFDDIDTPIRLQDGAYNKVSIGENCWIGAGAIVMADIGEGCIIAAGSVVTTSIPAFSVAAGTPAKVISTRTQNHDKLTTTQKSEMNMKIQCEKNNTKPVVMHLTTNLNMGGAERLSLSVLDKNRENFQGIIAGLYGEKGDLAKLAESMNIKSLALDAKGGRLQTIISLYKALKKHKVELLHVQAGYLLLFAFPAAKLAGIQIVYTEHALHSIQTYPMIRNGIRLFAPFMDGITSVNTVVKKYFVEKLKINSEDVKVIENGVDTSLFSPNGVKAELPWLSNNPDELFVFGTVARLCEAKDHPNMLHAFKIITEKYPQARLLMVGDGEERKNTEKLIQTLELSDKVHITGKALDIPERLRSMQTFVLSSQREGLPMVILEAMACGLPVISTDVGSIASLNIEPNNSEGRLLLVPPKNPQNLANAMEELIISEEKREKLSNVGISFIQEEKSDIIMAKSYLDLYKEGGLSC